MDAGSATPTRGRRGSASVVAIALPPGYYMSGRADGGRRSSHRRCRLDSGAGAGRDGASRRGLAHVQPAPRNARDERNATEAGSCTVRRAARARPERRRVSGRLGIRAAGGSHAPRQDGPLRQRPDGPLFLGDATALGRGPVSLCRLQPWREPRHDWPGDHAALSQSDRPEPVRIRRRRADARVPLTDHRARRAGRQGGRRRDGPDHPRHVRHDRRRDRCRRRCRRGCGSPWGSAGSPPTC